MKLYVPTKIELEYVRQWRNEDLSGLRTPFFLTTEMQEQFYRDVISNRESHHRYFAIHTEQPYIRMVGFGGITNIEWESSIGEISLIINPSERENRYGTEAADLLLDYAFNVLGLKTVFGETYECNVAGLQFWKELRNKYNGYSAYLRNRKYWRGQYWNSFYFSIDRDDFLCKLEKEKSQEAQRGSSARSAQIIAE